MQETMQYLPFDIGYGSWTPAASKAKPLMDAKVCHEDPKKGLHDVPSFMGTCNLHRRHIKNFTYTSAMLTDLIKKSTNWRWVLKNNKRLTRTRTKWLTQNAWGCPGHKEKLYW